MCRASPVEKPLVAVKFCKPNFWLWAISLVRRLLSSRISKTWTRLRRKFPLFPKNPLVSYNLVKTDGNEICPLAVVSVSSCGGSYAGEVVQSLEDAVEIGADSRGAAAQRCGLEVGSAIAIVMADSVAKGGVVVLGAVAAQ